MIVTPGTTIIGGTAPPGISVPGGIIIGGYGNVPTVVDVIDLTAAELDARVTYTGPSHLYFSQSSVAVSDDNQWPLEYRDGVAVGRHEPEPASTNVASAISLENMSLGDSSDYFETCRETVVNNYHRMRLDTTARELVTAQFIYRHAGRDYLALRASNSTAGQYSQVGINNGVIGYQAGGFNTASILKISDEMLILRATFIVTDSVVALCCSDAEVTTDDLPRYAGDTTMGFDRLFQHIEAGPIATSPLDLDSPAGGTRSAASVVVDTSGASSLTLVYSSGESEKYLTPDNTYTLPTASRNWATRYIQKIRLEN